MTNGQLFIRENPTIEVKINGSCVWIYFDGINHYTMPVKWWDKEIDVLDKIRERVSLEKLGYPPSAEYYKAIVKVLQIIDKYGGDRE